MTKNIRILALSALAASTLVLAACGGSSSSDATSAAPSESPIGGGSASCDQATLEGLEGGTRTGTDAEALHALTQLTPLPDDIAAAAI